MAKRNQPFRHHWHSHAFLAEIRHLPVDIEKVPCFLSYSQPSIFRLVCQNAIDLSIILLASKITRSSFVSSPILGLSTMFLGFVLLSCLCRDLGQLKKFLGVRCSFMPNCFQIMNYQTLNVKIRYFQP